MACVYPLDGVVGRVFVAKVEGFSFQELEESVE